MLTKMLTQVEAKDAFRRFTFGVLRLAGALLLAAPINSARAQLAPSESQIATNYAAMHACGVCLQKAMGVTQQEAKDKADHPDETLAKDLISCASSKGCANKLLSMTALLLKGKFCIEDADCQKMIAANQAKIKSNCELPDAGGKVRTLSICRNGYGITQAQSCNAPHAGSASGGSCSNLHCPTNNTGC